MQEGLGSIPGLSMPMCACVCHSLPLPGLSSLWVCCASCKDRLVRRGRVPNVTFESYIESRKLPVPRARPARTASRPARLEAALASPQRARTKGVRRQPAPPLESYRSPGRDQQEQLRVQRAWRPHSLRRSEHEPKECAGSLLRRGRVRPAQAHLLRRSEHEPKECAGSLLRRGRAPNVAFEWPLFAVGKRARPGKALKHLQGTVFSAEALSRPVRPFCFLSAAGALLWLVLAVGKGVRLVFLSAAGALLWFLSFSSLLPAKRGKRSFCGWPLPLDLQR